MGVASLRPAGATVRMSFPLQHVIIERCLVGLQAENLLAKANDAQYRRIVETANEGILSFDQDIRITFTNQQMAHMLGYTIGEMLGAAVCRLPGPVDAKPSRRMPC